MLLKKSLYFFNKLLFLLSLISLVFLLRGINDTGCEGWYPFTAPTFFVSFVLRIQTRDNTGEEKGEGWYLCKPPIDSCIPLPARDTG